MQLSLVQRKLRAAQPARRCRGRRRDGGLLAAFDARAAVHADRRPASRSARRSPPTWRRPHPMHRLLQGEVGSGKTRVRAARHAAGRRRRRAGGAARADRGAGRPALPQHRATCSGRSGRAGELDGADQATRGRAGHRLAGRGRPGGGRSPRSPSGAAGIVVGTHALLYEGVDFADLGLVVVDEQHRFGVEQRDALRAKADAAAARAGDDRHPDPAHGRDDRLRRPGDLDPDRAAGRPLADRLARRAGGREAGLPRPGLAAAARGGRGRATRRTSSARASAATSPTEDAAGAAPDDAGPPPADRGARGRAAAAPTGRCTGCGSASCTAGCPATRRTR